MNTRALKIFLTVCETKNMTSAAERLFMTQPAVSLAIADLEKELDFKLFERINNRIYLTPAGQKVQECAYQYLDFDIMMQKRMKNASDSSVIRIGATPSAFSVIVCPLIQAYRSFHANIDFYTTVDIAQNIQQVLLTGKLDIAFIDGIFPHANLLAEELKQDSIELICCRSAAQYNHIKNINDLACLSFLVTTPDDSIRQTFDRTMNELGIQYHIAGIYNNCDSIKRAVAFDHGIGVVPRSILFPYENNKHLSVTGFSCNYSTYLVYHANKKFSEQESILLEFIRQNAASLKRWHGEGILTETGQPARWLDETGSEISPYFMNSTT